MKINLFLGRGLNISNFFGRMNTNYYWTLLIKMAHFIFDRGIVHFPV